MAIIYVNHKMVQSACSRSLVAMLLEFGLGYLTRVWNQVSNTSGSSPWSMDLSNSSLKCQIGMEQLSGVVLHVVLKVLIHGQWMLQCLAWNVVIGYKAWCRGLMKSLSTRVWL